jgi:hypothetical protein
VRPSLSALLVPRRSLPLFAAATGGHAHIAGTPLSAGGSLVERPSPSPSSPPVLVSNPSYTGGVFFFHSLNPIVPIVFLLGIISAYVIRAPMIQSGSFSSVRKI